MTDTTSFFKENEMFRSYRVPQSPDFDYHGVGLRTNISNPEYPVLYVELYKSEDNDCESRIAGIFINTSPNHGHLPDDLTQESIDALFSVVSYNLRRYSISEHLLDLVGKHVQVFLQNHYTRKTLREALTSEGKDQLHGKVSTDFERGMLAGCLLQLHTDDLFDMEPSEVYSVSTKSIGEKYPLLQRFPEGTKVYSTHTGGYQQGAVYGYINFKRVNPYYDRNGVLVRGIAYSITDSYDSVEPGFDVNRISVRYLYTSEDIKQEFDILDNLPLDSECRRAKAFIHFLLSTVYQLGVSEGS